MFRPRIPYLVAFIGTIGGIAFIATLITAHARAQEKQTGPTSTVVFARDVQPIFATHCSTCHDAAKHKGGLRLDNRNEAMLGGDNGVDILARDPERSRLLHLVRGDDPDAVMPPKGARLGKDQIATLWAWIKEGAVWPDGVSITSSEALPPHWSFIKPVRPAVPAGLRQGEWVRNPLDAFVLKKLEANGLEPSAQADRYTLIRRASLDLTGLPPTPAEGDAFVADSRPDAYEKLIDRLLADPHFGERWARMWLDVARYADSAGYGSDPLRKTIYRYRDWVIDAFNRNLPYDQFTIDQIAGDLLPDPTPDQLLATAFNRNTMTNTEGGTDAEEFRVAAVKDRVDTTLQSWMGVTVGCATCHSHKYDPITNREYYQLFAIFNQTEDNNNGDESPTIPTPTPEQQQKFAQINEQVAQIERDMKEPQRLVAGEVAWERSLSQSPTNWTVFHPTRVASSAGATLTVAPDGSILASGKRGDADTYTVIAPSDLKSITAFRLEALPDPSLPAGGPGRAGDGNFVLTDFKAATAAAQGATIAGRYVRIENIGPRQYLHLAEVQVFSGAENAALKGRASQSSTDYGGDARRAIDGNADGEYFRSNSVSHTKEEKDPWWEVDLGAARNIDRIVIWNRTDGGSFARLTSGRVTVFDGSHKQVWQTRLAAPPNPSVEIGPSAAQAITLQNATDDFHQADAGAPGVEWSAAKAIDSDVAMSGWAIRPRFGQPHTAVFEANGNAGGPGATLTFTLTQNFATGSLGKFRISATSDPRPVRLLPATVTEALAVARAQRTAAQNEVLLAYYQGFAPELADLRKKIAQLQKEQEQAQPPRTAIMRELPKERRRENRVLVKGNFLNKGQLVQPAVLSAFHPMPKDAPPNRLGLATWIVDRDNPLTARVAVNRFWGQIFGIGIVETQEDFGTQGTPPSNQALLDWMAIEFQSNRWDVKGFLRTIVTSATYRQSSRVTPELLQRDPRNRLLSRGPRLRLEAELVRDQALALSGLLSPKMLGPSVYPPQPDGLWQAAFNGERTYPTSKGEDAHRRGIYTFWRRTTPYPSMAAFDAPSREVCTLRRIPTSTPLQAFVMMNDPVYVECAQSLGRRIMREGGQTPESRVAYAVKLCMAKPASDAVAANLLALYQGEQTRYQQDKAAAMKFASEPLGPLPAGTDPADAAAWTVVANVLLNLDGVLTRN